MHLQHFDYSILPSGLRIACAPMPFVRSVSAGLYLQIGSRYEGSEEAGISHFLEHMVFKGCTGWPTALDIAHEIEGRGGYLNASTGYEHTSFWIKIGESHWRDALRLLASMVTQPILDPVELERERMVILDEINMYRDVPEDLVSLLSNEAMWGDHPLGREIAGLSETVAAIDQEALAAFHRRTYRPSGAVFAIAGAVTTPEVEATVAAAFADWQAYGETPTMLAAPTESPEVRHRIYVRPSEQSHFQLAVPGLHRLHPQRYTNGLLNTILGDGMSSRLWQKLREERGLAYNIGSFTNLYADGGVMGIYGGCDAGRFLETLNEAQAVWQSLIQDGVTAQELQRAKDYASGRLELSSEDSSFVAGWWGRQLAVDTESLSLDEVLSAINQISREDVQELAQMLWQPQRLTLAYVGPVSDPAEIIDWLYHVN